MAEGLTLSSIAPFLTTVSAGVVTALVSVGLAIRRFRSERWWERKAQSYADLFQALFYVQLYAKRRVEELVDGASFMKNYMSDLNARSDSGYMEIRKAAAMGSFLFSKPVAKRIQRLESQLDDPHHNQDLLEELEADLKAVTTAMEELRPIALDDLKLS